LESRDLLRQENVLFQRAVICSQVVIPYHKYSTERCLLVAIPDRHWRGKSLTALGTPYSSDDRSPLVLVT